MTFPRRHPSAGPALAQDRRDLLAVAHEPWHSSTASACLGRRTDPEQRTGCAGQGAGLRVADLEHQADADKRRPAPISQAEFATRAAGAGRTD